MAGVPVPSGSLRVLVISLGFKSSFPLECNTELLLAATFINCQIGIIKYYVGSLEGLNESAYVKRPAQRKYQVSVTIINEIQLFQNPFIFARSQIENTAAGHKPAHTWDASAQAAVLSITP